MSRNPDYENLTNDRVFEAMNIVKNAEQEKRLTYDEYRNVMEVLDASVDPNEK